MPAEDEQLPTYGRFYIHSTVMGDTNPENKPQFHDVVMCEIAIKGDKNTSISKRVFESDGETPIAYPRMGQDPMTLIDSYPRAWKAYTAGSEDYMEGSPLDVLPGVGMSAKRNLQSEGIMSVEDLANLQDSLVMGKQGMLDLRKKARAYLAVLEPEKAEAKEAARQAEMNELKAQIAELQAAQKPKRGRPAKEA